MKKLMNEFKAFAFKGNVVDMAVGVIIGGAFGKIVTSLLDDIIMPLIGLLFQADFTNWGIVLSAHPDDMSVGAAAEAGLTVLKYGNFISVVINFFIVTLCIFAVVKALNAAKTAMEKKPEPAPEEPKKAPRLCPYCFQEIDEKATRCPHCTSELK